MGVVVRAAAGLGLLALGAAGGALLRDAWSPVFGVPDGASSDRANPDPQSPDPQSAEHRVSEHRRPEPGRPVEAGDAPDRSLSAEARADADATAALRARAEQAEAALAAARQALAEARREAESARAAAAVEPPAATRVAELERALATAESDVEQLAELRAELAAARSDAERERERLEARLADRARALAEGEQRLREARLELEARDAELERARAEAAAADRLRAREAALAAEPRVTALFEELDALWPARPERVGAFEDWLERARAELGRLDELRARRAELAEELAASDVEGARAADDDRAWTLARLDRLIERLEALADPVRGALAGRSPEHGWGVALRLDFAGTVRERSVASPAAAARWDGAAERLAEDPRFDGAELAPAPGWVPLGPDPESGLLEFCALATGAVPERDADGRLVLDEDSGAVAVLVPGGRVWLGSQADDRDGPNHDPLADAADGPVRAVELGPYLIGKHELTQAQWERLTGARPSRYGPGRWGGRTVDRTHPVTDVSWERGTRTLERHGLRLPTEAEWEAAARARTAGPWWTGTQVRSLEGAANLADAFAARNGGGSWAGRLEWLDDGHTVAAPVDAYRANPFGLHGVHGNVWEWCADSFAPLPPASGAVAADPRVELDTTTLRVIRGGAFNSNALDARASHRSSSPAGRSGASLGLRIAAEAPLVDARD